MNDREYKSHRRSHNSEGLIRNILFSIRNDTARETSMLDCRQWWY